MKGSSGSNFQLKIWVGGLIVLLGTGLSLGQTSTTATSGVPEVVSAVPADAWAAIVVKNLAASSKVIDDYAAKLGTQAPNAYLQITRKLGIGGQLDATKPMVVVIMEKDKYPPQPVASIFSVKDYEKFAEGMNGKATQTPGLMQGENEEIGTVFFAKKGPFVVMGPSEAIVNAIVTSKQGFGAGMDPDAKKLLASSDVYVRVNFQALNQTIKPLLMGIGAMIQMGAMGGMGGLGGMGGEAASQPSDNATLAAKQAQAQALGTLINAFVGFLDELSSLDLGVRLNPDVINTAMTVNFKGGQEMAASLAAQKQTAKSLLVGVPGGGFSMTGGWQWTPKITKLHEALLQMTPSFSDPADAEKFKKINRQSAEMVTGTAFKMDFRTPKPGEPMIRVQAVLETKDSKKYLDLLKQSVDLQAKATMPMAGGQELKMDYKYVSGAAKVGGVSIDEFTVDLGKMLSLPGVPGTEMQQAKAILAMMMGNPNAVLRFKAAAVNEKAVIFDFGSAATELEGFIKMAQTGSTPLSVNAKIVQTAGLLPKERFMEMYVDFGKIISGAMGAMMGMAGAEAGATSQPVLETPLVGMTGSIQGSTLRLDLVLPFEVVTKLNALKSMVPGMGMPGETTPEEKSEKGAEQDTQ